MKRAVNLRLEEGVIMTLNKLSEELHSTKTEIIEKAIKLFSKENHLQQNQLLQFAGKITKNDADKMILAIHDDKKSKDFELDL